MPNKHRLDPTLLFRRAASHAIESRRAANYDGRRDEAERRIAARDPDDWPTVALALTLGLPIWSQDKDLTSAGLDVVATGDLRDAGHNRLGPLKSDIARAAGTRRLAHPDEHLGPYHSVSSKWLPSYLNEYVWRYNERNNTTRSMFESLLARAAE